jgi:restriction endonuclease S subunit
MKNIEIELPPIEVQIEISKNMKHLDSKIKIESDYLNLLKSQKNYLLKNMFT